MKTTNTIMAALALSTGMASLALAQSTTAPTTAPATPPTTAPMTGPSTQHGPMAMPGATAPSATAAAPTTMAPGGGASSNNAVATSSQTKPGAPFAGANSFTEGEAARRIGASGFTQASNLKLDERGIWRGTAMKDGKSVQVALDYQGNVVAQ